MTGPRNAGLTSARRPVALLRPAMLPQLSSGARERRLAPVVATSSERVQEVAETPQRVVRARVLPLSLLPLFTAGLSRGLAPRGAACSPPRAPSGAFLRTGAKNGKNARLLSVRFLSRKSACGQNRPAGDTWNARDSPPGGYAAASATLRTPREEQRRYSLRVGSQPTSVLGRARRRPALLRLRSPEHEARRAPHAAQGRESSQTLFAAACASRSP